MLNGSGTEGIAAAVKAILEDSGMTVVKIADNPEVIENTIIYVAKMEWEPTFCIILTMHRLK